MTESNNKNDRPTGEQPLSDETQAEYRKISEQELKQILEDHKKWLESDGKELILKKPIYLKRTCKRLSLIKQTCIKLILRVPKCNRLILRRPICNKLIDCRQYRDLFNIIRALDSKKRPTPIALDLPKSKYKGKISRDEWMAESIASVFESNSNAKMLVVVGNNHMLKKLDW